MAQDWLRAMSYDLEEIESVKSYKDTKGHIKQMFRLAIEIAALN